MKGKNISMSLALYSFLNCINEVLSVKMYNYKMQMAAYHLEIGSGKTDASFASRFPRGFRQRNRLGMLLAPQEDRSECY